MTDVKEFSSLVDMQRWACATFGDRPAIGTKRDGAYAWTTFAELGELVDVDFDIQRLKEHNGRSLTVGAEHALIATATAHAVLGALPDRRRGTGAVEAGAAVIADAHGLHAGQVLVRHR